MKLDLDAIRARLNNLTQIPNKIFPIALVGPGEQYRILNEYLQYGLEVQIDVVALLDEVTSLEAKLAIANKALYQIMKIGTTGHGNTQECDIAYRAIGDIANL